MLLTDSRVFFLQIISRPVKKVYATLEILTGDDLQMDFSVGPELDHTYSNCCFLSMSLDQISRVPLINKFINSVATCCVISFRPELSVCCGSGFAEVNV